MGYDQLVPPGTYLTTGPEFSRITQWLRHFDAAFYRTFPHVDGHSDLKHLDDSALVKHFIETGWIEGRPYSRFLNSFLEPEFYIERYPDLGLKTDLDAARHWMFEGFYEGRVPNRPTQWMLDSEIHLFQVGKVGSKAIEKALYDAGYELPIVHLHWPSEMMTTYPECVYSYEEVVRREPRKPLKFITGVRDPIARVISAYFETEVSNSVLSGLNVESVIDSIIGASFNDGQVDFVLNWFDHQFFREVDVFSVDFDISRGYTIIEQDETEVFVYRFEDLEGLGKPLSRFVELPMNLTRVNASKDKPYHRLYRAAVDALTVPARDLERVMTSKLVRHFYAPQEIDRMYDRWAPR